MLSVKRKLHVSERDRRIFATLTVGFDVESREHRVRLHDTSKSLTRSMAFIEKHPYIVVQHNRSYMMIAESGLLSCINAIIVWRTIASCKRA
jgi:hypothetical protein